MTNDKINWPTEAEVRAAFPSPPDFGATIRMMPVADHEAEIARLTAERDAALAGAVKVKPLVWDETHDDRGDGSSDHNGGYEANSEFDVYEIGMGFGSDSYYWSVQDEAGNEIGSFDDPDAAKAAAQADYEARIRAALQPDPNARQADLAKAWVLGRDAAAETPAHHAEYARKRLGATTHPQHASDWSIIVSRCDMISDAIRALTPPADMAARIGGE